MLKVLLMTSLFLFAVSIAIFLYRFVKGPSIPDRIIAMDAIGISLIAMMAILSILLKTYAFFDVILLFGILSFAGNSRFLHMFPE
jgi:multicomponent Na+:H+ antiporter subunit F